MLAALILAAAGASGPPATLVRYDVEEAVHALTPAGPRERAVAGTVSSLGRRARWDLKASHFPGVTARSALWDGARFDLLDPEASTATPATPAEFEDLLRPAPGPAGPSSTEVRDLTVAVDPDGTGAPFEGGPTDRWSVRCAWSLVSAQPGRLVRVRYEVNGRIETVRDPSLVPTPFDDLLRLFTVRGDARDALEAQLRKVKGLPVRVRLEAVSEAMAETVGPGSGASPASPVKATSTTTRAVSNLRKSPGGEGEASLFSVPESYRSLPFERAKAEGAPPR